MKIVAGTRGSALALKQTELVARALKALDPSLEVGVEVIQTTGDANLSPIPLDSIGKGWFTGEIEDALLSGRIDIAVHSLKDLAEEQPQGLSVAAYPEREDARDALVSNHAGGLLGLPQGAVVGTDSVRRGVQLRALRPDLVVKSVRGNVPTRIDKLRDKAQGYDAVVLAVAGLRRLGLEGEIAQYFSESEMTPAPGQGVLAVQARDGDARIRGMLAAIDNPLAAGAARIERAFSVVVGGGCKAPTGAFASQTNGVWTLVGMAAQGDRILRKSLSQADGEDGSLGERLARLVLEQLLHDA
jgi:hydroxymethylbilane synthase